MPTNQFVESSFFNFDALFNVNTTTQSIEVQVIGHATNTVSWKCNLTYKKLGYIRPQPL